MSSSSSPMADHDASRINVSKKAHQPQSHYHSNEAMKLCVCAPTTHAGSFKCRLHRVNSHVHHHHHQSQQAPLQPQPAVSTSSTRTVEAQ